jgi:CHASE2 domain-containing sensor protein
MAKHTFPSGGWWMKKVVRDNRSLIVVVSGGGWTWLRLMGGVVGVFGNRWKKKKGMAMNTCDLFWFLLVAALLVTWLVFVASSTPPPFSL